MKWVKYDEGGETAEDSEQPTEEQVTAAITGARTLLEPPGSNAGTPAPAGTPAASGTQSSSSMLSTIPGDTPSAPSPAVASQPQPQPQPQPASAIPESAAPEVEAEQPQETIPPQVEQQVVARTPQEQVAEEASLVPGKEDEGGNMEVEQEQREHDVRMAPELIGKAGEEMRAVLGESYKSAFFVLRSLNYSPVGISDPVQGGPPEVRD